MSSSCSPNTDIHFAPNTSAIYILHPTITELRVGGVAGSHVSFFMSSMFRDIHFAPNTSVIYILHPTIPSYTYTFLNVNLEFWNFDFVYDNKGEIYFNFSFFMSSLFRDILFAPNTSAIYILHPTITELRVGEWRVHMFHFSPNTVQHVLHVSFFMSMFRDIHFAPNTSIIYILHPTIPSYTYTFLNVNLEFWNFDFVYDNKGEIYFNFSFFMSSLFRDILFAPNTSAIYILHPTITDCGLAESRVHMFHFSCPACSVIYILHPTLPSYTFCTQQFRHILIQMLFIYFLHPTLQYFAYKQL
jgi:hypothetical protein